MGDIVSYLNVRSGLPQLISVARDLALDPVKEWEDSKEGTDNAPLLTLYNGCAETKKVFIRGLYGATFKMGEFDFTFVITHFIFGDSIDDRRGEAKLLDEAYIYFQEVNGSENDVIIAGDFNLEANDIGFNELFNLDVEIQYVICLCKKTTIGNNKSPRVIR